MYVPYFRHLLVIKKTYYLNNKFVLIILNKDGIWWYYLILNDIKELAFYFLKSNVHPM